MENITSILDMNFPITIKAKRPSRSLAASEKVQAIERIHNGETKASVSRDIGIPESTIRGWCKNEFKLRCMSYQAAEAENITNESLNCQFYENVNTVESSKAKRPRLDYSMPHNLSDIERAPLASLDFNANKSLNDRSASNGFNSDLKAFNGSLSQSSLALNFNEISKNFNLLAQFNPEVAAMYGLNSTNQISVKQENWTAPTSSSTSDRVLDLSQKNYFKNQLKNSINPSFPIQFDASLSSLLPALSEDSLYKSIMTILNTNNLYPPVQSPICSSTPKNQSLNNSYTDYIMSLPKYALSTPSRSLNDKQPSWLQSAFPLGSKDDFPDIKQEFNNSRFGVADCKDILDNILNSINNDVDNGNGNSYGNDTQYALAFNKTQGMTTADISQDNVNNSQKSFENKKNVKSSKIHNNNIKVEENTDFRETIKHDEAFLQKSIENKRVVKSSKIHNNEIKVAENNNDFREAIKHGEAFLQWLEKSNNPRVTVEQLLQLQILLTSLKNDLNKSAYSKTDVSSTDINHCSEELKSLKLYQQPSKKRKLSNQNYNKIPEIIDADEYKMKTENFTIVVD